MGCEGVKRAFDEYACLLPRTLFCHTSDTSGGEEGNNINNINNFNNINNINNSDSDSDRDNNDDCYKEHDENVRAFCTCIRELLKSSFLLLGLVGGKEEKEVLLASNMSALAQQVYNIKSSQKSMVKLSRLIHDDVSKARAKRLCVLLI